MRKGRERPPAGSASEGLKLVLRRKSETGRFTWSSAFKKGGGFSREKAQGGRAVAVKTG